MKKLKLQFSNEPNKEETFQEVFSGNVKTCWKPNSEKTKFQSSIKLA